MKHQTLGMHHNTIYVVIVRVQQDKVQIIHIFHITLLPKKPKIKIITVVTRPFVTNAAIDFEQNKKAMYYGSPHKQAIITQIPFH
jgi:hypothetical protein